MKMITLITLSVLAAVTLQAHSALSADTGANIRSLSDGELSRAIADSRERTRFAKAHQKALSSTFFDPNPARVGSSGYMAGYKPIEKMLSLHGISRDNVVRGRVVYMMGPDTSAGEMEVTLSNGVRCVLVGKAGRELFGGKTQNEFGRILCFDGNKNKVTDTAYDDSQLKNLKDQKIIPTLAEVVEVTYDLGSIVIPAVWDDSKDR